MKNSKIITVVLILVLVAVFLTVFKSAVNESGLVGNDSLLSPVMQKLSGQKVLPSQAPSIIVAPKTYTFDSSTDLKKELDNVNPQVLDSDFE